MSNTKSTQRRRGRPQGDEVKIAILKAANELLEEQGLSGFTIDAVATRSGAARSSIYRWWPNRGALAIAGFLAETAQKIAYPATGSAVADIKSQLMRVAEVYGQKVGRTISALVAQGQSDPEALKALLEGYVLPRRDEAKKVLARGVANGELRAGIDFDVVIDALYGPIWYRILVPHAPLSREWAAALADHVFGGLMASPAAPEGVVDAAGSTAPPPARRRAARRAVPQNPPSRGS
ncbi:TetR/AcrR family transcriptional regulator [Xanthobacter oligotrophicus]|uniref:TetR/AcrR family transcriptional regulator n=1 Tax=Xanthobacter oligotrophicus TaxID=2607286 RepID=A0ABW6ZX44_9HYPH